APPQRGGGRPGRRRAAEQWRADETASRRDRGSQLLLGRLLGQDADRGVRRHVDMGLVVPPGLEVGQGEDRGVRAVLHADELAGDADDDRAVRPQREERNILVELAGGQPARLHIGQDRGDRRRTGLLAHDDFTIRVMLWPWSMVNSLISPPASSVCEVTLIVVSTEVW